MLHWQSQDAKAKFSKIMRMAKDEPQIITVHGKEEAVLLSKSQYDSLLHKKPSLVSLMKNSPMSGINLKIDRDESLPRNIDL